MVRVGANLDLVAEKRLGLAAELADGQGEQAGGNLLAGGDDDIDLAVVRILAQRARE